MAHHCAVWDHLQASVPMLVNVKLAGLVFSGAHSGLCPG